MTTKRLASGNWSIRADDLETNHHEIKQCQRQPLPEIAGIGHTDFYQLDPGLSYIETCYKPSKNLAILSRTDSQEPRMVITVTLSGQSSFKSHKGQEVLFSQGYTTITTFNSSIGMRLYKAYQDTTQLRFSVGKKWIEHYLDEKIAQQVFNKSGIQQISFRPISGTGISSANQLLTCNPENPLKHVFMQGQALTLLASELKHLFSDDRQDTEKLNLRDMNTAQAAREILLREFRNPPTINELSKRVGTNHYKLKQLFHQYFDKTPYGMVLEFRMNQAFDLLQTTHCQVSHAADFVGYSHASNFSAAFVKHFGFSPKMLTKRN